jgi:hypothetical protein
VPFDSGLQNDGVERLTLHSKTYPGRDLIDELLHYSSFGQLEELTVVYDFAGQTYAQYEPGPLLDPKEPVQDRYPKLKRVNCIYTNCPPDFDAAAKAEIINTSVFLLECQTLGILHTRFSDDIAETLVS